MHPFSDEEKTFYSQIPLCYSLTIFIFKSLSKCLCPEADLHKKVEKTTAPWRDDDLTWGVPGLQPHDSWSWLPPPPLKP